MDCQSCESQIDPKWKHATESNVCPFCGEQIMEEELRELLHSLREIMEVSAQEKYAAPVMDWLHSNCGLIHKSDIKKYLTDEDKKEFIDIGIKQAKEEFKNSVFMKKTESNETESLPDEGVVIDKASDGRTSEFLQRAGVAIDGEESVAEKTQRLKSERTSARKNIKELVSKIQNGDEENFTVQEPMETVALYPEEDSNVSEVSDILLDNEQIPSHVLALAASGKADTSGSNMKDMLTLQRLKNKKRSSFNRSNKNGFSRSD